MTNPDSTLREASPTGAGRRRFRPFVKATLATFVAMLGVGFFASPAFAHANSVSTVTSCQVSGANYVITWTIANDWYLTETATVTATSAAGGLATVSPTSVPIAATPNGTPVGSYKTATVTQTLPATTTGTVSITVVGKWSDNATQTATGNVTLGSGCSGPSIGLSKSVSTSFANNVVPAGSSSPVVYTLAVKNNGQLPTTSGVTVTDSIPANTTYVAGSATCVTGGSPSCAAAESAGKVTFTLGSPIFGGATYDVSFAVTVNASAPSGTIPNTAYFTGPGCTTASPGCGSNTVTITVTSTPVVISVAKTANVSAVTAGQSAPVVYTLTVTNPANSSTASAQDVTLTDVVPGGLTYVSASCGALSLSTTPSCSSSYDSSTRTVSYTLGTGIAPGASYPVTFQATVNAGDTTSIVNTADYTGPGCTTAAPGCQTNPVAITVANFTVAKSDSAGSGTVNPGQVVTYTLTADNVGSGPGSVTVSDSAPTGTTLTTPAPACPANTSSTCAVAVSGSSISWTITGMPAGSSYALTFAVEVNSGTGGMHITNTGVYTEPGCTTAGGCSTNTTDNPVPPPTNPGTPTTTTTTPTTTVKTATNGGAISNATSVHTGEPWAGSTPYVLIVLGVGVSLLGLGQVRRRRAAKAPTN